MPLDGCIGLSFAIVISVFLYCWLLIAAINTDIFLGLAVLFVGLWVYVARFLWVIY